MEACEPEGTPMTHEKLKATINHKEKPQDASTMNPILQETAVSVSSVRYMVFQAMLGNHHLPCKPPHAGEGKIQAAISSALQL